jgi:transposase
VFRETGLSRNTIRKYLKDSSPPSYHRQVDPVRHKLCDYEGRLQNLFEHDLKLPRRKRRTATRLYEQLVLEGYTGSYSPVQRFIRDLKRAGLGSGDAFIPLHFQSGDALQFDWSEEHVVLGGIAQKVKVAHVRLCHSRKPFVVAYPGEPQEMVLDAFVRALAFYGGVPRRVIIPFHSLLRNQLSGGGQPQDDGDLCVAFQRSGLSPTLSGFNEPLCHGASGLHPGCGLGERPG